MGEPRANDALYATPEFVSYSLWLVPDDPAESKLRGVIQDLAERLGTPPFLPHATLLGVITGLESHQAVELTRRVALRLSALDAEIAVVSSKDLLYFQCVFGLLKLSDDLRDAHRIAMEVFERVDEPEFMPHISLVYGELSSEDRKALAQEQGPHVDGMVMKLDRLQVWNTTGPVKNWRLVADFPLPTRQDASKN